MFRQELGIFLNREQWREYKRLSETDKQEFIHRLEWYYPTKEEINVQP